MNMGTNDFLKEQLSKFVKSHKNVKMNYEYDELASLHTIEVLPQSVFDGDEFVMWECDFFKKAFEIIPGEDISFISEDAYVGLEHINWSVQGDDFGLDEKIQTNSSKDNLSISSSNFTEQNTISSCTFEIFDTFQVESSEHYHIDDNYKNSINLNNNSTKMSFDGYFLEAA